MYAWSIIDKKMKYNLADIGVEKYREIVICRYKQLLNKYKGKLGFDVRKQTNDKITDKKCVICHDVVDMKISKADPMKCGHHDILHQNCILMWSLYNSYCPICHELLPETCIYNIDMNFDTEMYIKKEKIDDDVGTEMTKKLDLRLTNDNKRKLYQNVQGERMKKRYKHSVKLDLGTSVNLKVDIRDRKSSQIRALVGIVVKIRESDTSFLCGIATRHGVLSSRKKIIMYDPASFVELKKPTLSSELANLQRNIINGEITFDKIPHITVSQAHKMEYSS